MLYTIKHATSHKDNNNVEVDLDKNGNKYVISAWERGVCKTVERVECGRYEEAEIVFSAMCNKYNTLFIDEPEQTWDATDFD